MRKRRTSKPAKPKGKVYWYSETIPGSKWVHARITDEGAKTLRRFARRLECLVMDTASGHPVPSTRALVQALAEGHLTITRVTPASPITPPPNGACPD